MGRQLMAAVLFSKVFLYALPGILFVVLLLSQACFHFLTWRKDKNAYVPTGIYRELDPEIITRLGIHIDTRGKYYFSDTFLDNLLRGRLGDVSNVRFRRQDNIVLTGQVEPFQALFVHRQLFLQNPIKIAVKPNQEQILCDRKEAKEIILALDDLDLNELLAIASRFACDCLGFEPATFNPKTLDQPTLVNYQNAILGFLRQALNLFRPVQVPVNLNLGFSDFLRFALFTNMTMSSPDLVPRSRGAQHATPFFTVLSYFLLATQAATLAFAYEKLIP